MIASLNGRVVEKSLSHCVIEVSGVGYEISMSTNSLAALPALGDEVMILTHTHVREDEISLFGFENAEEKKLFGMLITVSGIGPKVALAALSSYAPSVLSDAISREDVALVSSVPGIGKKTAQRMILDLKDKVEVAVSGEAPSEVGLDAMAEARDGLLAMGFTSAEVATAMKGYSGAPSDTQALVKHALKRLGGGA